MRLEIANHHTRPKSKCPTNNTRNEKECILLVEQQQLLTPRDSDKEKLSFAVLLAACALSLRYLERAIRARTFCVMRKSERRGFVKKKNYEKI